MIRAGFIFLTFYVIWNVVALYWKKKKNYNAEESRRKVCDWQTADPTTAVFTAEYARTGEPQRNAKGTRLKGTQLRLNSVDPAVFTHTGGAGGSVRVLSVSSSSRSLTPRYALSTVSTSYLSLSSSLSPGFSLGRVLRQTFYLVLLIL